MVKIMEVAQTQLGTVERIDIVESHTFEPLALTRSRTFRVLSL